MKRSNVILFAVVLTGLLSLAGIMTAQETMEKADKDVDVNTPAIERGIGGMMGGPGMMGMGHIRMRERGRMMGEPGMMGMGPMGMMPRLPDELKLSKEQQDELDGIFTSHRKDMIRKKAELELARVELEKLIRQENPDLEAIKVSIQDIANMEAEMKFSQIKVGIDAKNILTEEQRAELKKLQNDRMDQIKKGRIEQGRVGRNAPGPKPNPRRGSGW